MNALLKLRKLERNPSKDEVNNNREATTASALPPVVLIRDQVTTEYRERPAPVDT